MSKTAKYTADWKEKTVLSINRKSYFPKRCKKNHLICKIKLPQKNVTWKRSNEGYFFVSFVSVFNFSPSKIVSKTYPQWVFRTSVGSNLKLVFKNVKGRIRNRKYIIFELFGQHPSICEAASKHTFLQRCLITSEKQSCFLRSLYKFFSNVYTRSPTNM